MSPDDPRHQMIKANAELVIDQLGPLAEQPFGLDRGSVAWTAGFIERQRANASIDEVGQTRMLSVLACYLGEAIIATAGGAWEDTSEGELGIHFANGNWCFPIAKVAKQFADGSDAGESILSFYDISTTIVAGESGAREG